MIKYFESTDAGAPTLNNAVGSMIALLDACLITGYNSKAVTSITVASGVATVVCTAHGYANTYGKAIRIAGATPVGLNKDTQIANVSTNGFTFLCPGVADGVATGTLTAKYAPLDWTKQYSGTNKAMYKRGDVTATGCMLRIDDTAVGQSCRALMVNSATDVDTYTGPAPLAAQITDGLGQYWSKGYNSSTAASWMLVSDGLAMYLFVSSALANLHYLAHGFGDMIDFKPGSVMGCTIAGPAAAGSNNAYTYYGNVTSIGAWVVAGGKNGVTTSQVLCLGTAIVNYGVGDGAVYPSDVDGGLVIAYPMLINEASSTGSRRGVLPGFAIPLGNVAAVLPSKTQISNVIGYPRVFLCVSCAQFPGANVAFYPLIDLTGPWR